MKMEYKIQIFSTFPAGEPSFSGVLYKDAVDRMPPDGSGIKSKGSNSRFGCTAARHIKSRRGYGFRTSEPSPREVMHVIVGLWLVKLARIVIVAPL